MILCCNDGKAGKDGARVVYYIGRPEQETALAKNTGHVELVT